MKDSLIEMLAKYEHADEDLYNRRARRRTDARLDAPQTHE